MSSTTKRIIAGVVLTALPIIAVNLLKKTAWGQFVATPIERQKGDPNAPVLLVEYSDFQCPMCAQIQPTLHQLLETYKGKIRVAYKFFPLTTIHPNAMPASHAAQCAAEQGKFWPYHDGLFQNQMRWARLPDPTTWFMTIAQASNLEMTKFTGCYADPSREIIVEADHREGKNRQINSTPTLFIGEERLVGPVIASDAALTIEKQLRK